MPNSKRKRLKGFVLVLAVILIIFVALIVAAVTIFINQRLVGYDIEQRVGRCRYNAQAGINYAIYQYRQSGTTYAAPTTVNIDANNSFVITTASAGGGGAASSMVVNATLATLASGNRNLTNVTIQNTSGAAITIDTMTVTWTGTRNLQNITINGVSVWSGSTTSPATVNITNFTLAAGTTYPITQIRWSGSMSGQTVTLLSTMTDASNTSTCTVFPAQASTCTTPGSNLTIRSMGKTTGSTLYKTIQAAYNVSTGNISDYEEQATAVP